jgi:hypothetical protein
VFHVMMNGFFIPYVCFIFAVTRIGSVYESVQTRDFVRVGNDS